MGYSITTNSRPPVGDAGCSTGRIETDAVAHPSTTVSFASGQSTSSAIGSTAGLLAGMYVEIDQFAAGALVRRTILRTVAAQISVHQFHAAPAALNNVLLQPCVFVRTGGMPRRVQLLDVTNRVDWLWVEGMEPDTALKRDAAGVATLQARQGISPIFGGFWMSQAMLPASSMLAWSAEV